MGDQAQEWSILSKAAHLGGGGATWHTQAVPALHRWPHCLQEWLKQTLGEFISVARGRHTGYAQVKCFATWLQDTILFLSSHWLLLRSISAPQFVNITWDRFSTHIHSIGDLIQALDFKYSLYTDNPQMYTSSLDLSCQLLTGLFSCLLFISKWMSVAS